LYNLQNLMSENIDLILDRDKSLNQIVNKSTALKDGSKMVLLFIPSIL